MPPVPPGIVRTRLPVPFDRRITAVLGEALPDPVVIAFAHVAAEKSPTTNYRYEVAASGELRYVQHSGKAGDWQVPFDQPLPANPARRLTAAELSALDAALDRAQFFSHPGYEANPQTEGGSYYIVRARRGGQIHAVVFHNVKPPLVGELDALATPLWKQP